jgi:hypothetical protein
MFTPIVETTSALHCKLLVPTRTVTVANANPLPPRVDLVVVAVVCCLGAETVTSVVPTMPTCRRRVSVSLTESCTWAPSKLLLETESLGTATAPAGLPIATVAAGVPGIVLSTVMLASTLSPLSR